MSKISDFVTYLNAQVGAAYVWGAQGEQISLATGNVSLDGKVVDLNYTSWVRSMESSDTNATRALAFIQNAKLSGKKTITFFDCSGLCVYWLLGRKLINSDMTASNIYKACDKLTRAQLQIGDFVFRYTTKISHIGYVVAIQNNKPVIIEAYGRDKGVVRGDIDIWGSAYWNRYGRLPSLQEKDVPIASMVPYYAYCSGSRVNVRTGRGTSAPIIATASKGDLILALPAQDGWCEVQLYIDGKPISGYMSANYVKTNA